MKKGIPIGILGVAVAGFLILLKTAPEQQPVQPHERSWLINGITIQPQPLSPVLTLYGRVETPDLLDTAAPRDAYVAEIYVREGDPVTRGQTLARLDPRDFELRIQQYQADVDQLNAQIVSEKTRFRNDQKIYEFQKKLIGLGESAVERSEKLKSRNLGSSVELDEAFAVLNDRFIDLTSKKQDIDDHPARLDQLQAQLARAEAELGLARLDLERSVITAPFQGYIDSIAVTSGDPVSTNDSLLSLYPRATLEIRAKIPSQYQWEIQQSISQQQMLHAYFLLNQERFELTLKRLAGSADPRGIDGLFTLVEEPDKLRTGSALTLHLQRPLQDHAVAIPYSALYGNDLIYRVINGRLHSVKIRQLGEYQADDGQSQLLVKSPELKAGDIIATTHLPNAMSGLKVDLISDTPL